MYAVVRETGMSQISRIPDNFWDHYTGFRSATPEVVKELLQLREVSKTLLGIVDKRLVDEDTWKTLYRIRAAEFCDDLAPGEILPPSSAAGDGLRRMLNEPTPSSHPPLRALLAGLHKFLYDATTQERILAALLNYLNFNPMHDYMMHAGFNPIEHASNTRVHTSIINILRVHAENVCIARYACAILSRLRHMRNMRHDLQIYTLSTLSVVMQKHPTTQQIHCDSLEVIDTITGSFNWRPFFMADSHNMLEVVVHSMTLFHDAKITILALNLMETFANFVADKREYDTTMHLFQFEIVEALVLARMHTYITKSRVQNPGMATLMYLSTGYPDRMKQQTAYPQRVLNALMQPSQLNRPENAVGLILAIVPHFWCPLLPSGQIEAAKTTLVGTALIPFLVSCVCHENNTPKNKTICTQLFKLLSQLCQNHSEHIAVVRDHQVLQILDDIFCPCPAADTDLDWRKHRDIFATMLTP